MTDLSRGTRARRGARRPGWLLLTALLVLAIGASSALVFTNRVELLKLAVILALWAAVVAAFVSVIYRRQSDIDQAKVRDLKLVYDLQLDREISARREYELTVETQLRRELTSEIRAQAADEVAGLRAELAALRANLEILFDADLSHRPALETDRSTARAYSDWPPQHGIRGPGHRQPDRHRRPRGHRGEHRGKPDHRRACRTASARGRLGAGTELRRCAPQTVGGRAGGAAPSRRGAAARVVTTASATAAPASSRSRSPHPSPNSLGSHRNRSAHPPRRPNRHRRRPPSRSRSRRRRRIGSLRPPRESGYPRAHRAATGCRLPCQIRRLSRRARTAPPANMSAGGGHPSRRCSLRPPNPAAGATQLRRTPSILDARRRHRRWPPNPGVPRHTPSLSRRPNRRLRSRRRGDTAARRTPAGSRLPSCWRGFRPPRPEAAVAGAATSELGS